MNESLIRSNIQAYTAALKKHYPKAFQVFYASKAFLNLSMAHLVAQEGIGLDVCSEGELFVAKSADFPLNRILFHGNNKSYAALEQAITDAIQVIVVDNHFEYSCIETITKKHGCKPNVMLRVNPYITVDTHPSIATGVRGSKFGLPIENPHTLDLIKNMSGSSFVVFQGIHCHIGSQVLDFQAYTDELKELVHYMATLKTNGVPIPVLNIGGGLGVKDTTPSAQMIHQWVAHVCKTLIALCAEENLPLPELMVEPGRSIVSEAGCTLYRIGAIKDVENTRNVAVQGGMSDNIRPALLGAQYSAVVANKIDQPNLPGPCKIVGSCCESGDILIPQISIPDCQEGDILALFHTGAYSFALANQYNKHPLPGMIFVREGGAYDGSVALNLLSSSCKMISFRPIWRAVSDRGLHRFIAYKVLGSFQFFLFCRLRKT
jgi:diaminopimelate decarboxylase